MTEELSESPNESSENGEVKRAIKKRPSKKTSKKTAKKGAKKASKKAKGDSASNKTSAEDSSSHSSIKEEIVDFKNAAKSHNQDKLENANTNQDQDNGDFKNRRRRRRPRNNKNTDRFFIELDQKQVAQKAWKIFMGEVAEEGLALIDEKDARDLAKRSYRLAEVFLEEVEKKKQYRKRQDSQHSENESKPGPDKAEPVEKVEPLVED